MISHEHEDGRIQALSAISLFVGCPAREVAAVARLTTPLRVEAGRVLCCQGDIGRAAFIIERGHAAAVVNSREISRLGPGSFFGEMALLDGGYRTATVTATTPMGLFVVHIGEFSQLLEEAPTVARRMLVALSGRLRLVERPQRPVSQPAQARGLPQALG